MNYDKLDIPPPRCAHPVFSSGGISNSPDEIKYVNENKNTIVKLIVRTNEYIEYFYKHDENGNFYIIIRSPQNLPQRCFYDVQLFSPIDVTKLKEFTF